MAEETRRDQRIPVQVSREEKNAIAEAAARSGIGASAYLRLAGLKAAREEGETR